MVKELVFFVDLDNTLIDNDGIKAKMRDALVGVLGEEEADHFWKHHDSFREEADLIDFPEIVRQYCREQHADTCELKISSIFEGINFAAALFEGSIDVLRHLKTLGRVLLFTEGDKIYQQHKIDGSGVGAEVDEVLLYEHKMAHLTELASRFSDAQLVFLDDKVHKLKEFQDKIPGVFVVEVCQGHYATVDHQEHSPFDLSIDHIGDMLRFSKQDFLKE